MRVSFKDNKDPPAPEENIYGMGGWLDEAAAVDGFFEPELKRRYVRDSNETITATGAGAEARIIEFVVQQPDQGQPHDGDDDDDDQPDPAEWQDIFEAAAAMPRKRGRDDDGNGGDGEGATPDYVDTHDFFDGEEGAGAEDDGATVDDADEPQQGPEANAPDYLREDLLDPHRTLNETTYPELYRRSAAPHVDPLNDELVFQHVETTYDMDYKEQCPVVRIWGTTAEGHSVLIEDRTFLPYFFVAIPTFDEQVEIEQRLEAFLRERFHTTRVAGMRRPKNHKGPWEPPRPFDGYVYSMIEEPVARPLRGPDQPDVRMVRVTLRAPSHVAAARNALEQANRAVVSKRYITYEANVPFELRYMIDHNMYGCQWLRVPRGVCNDVPAAECKSRAQYEWRVRPDVLPADKWEPQSTEKRADIGPKRILFYDIEVFRKDRGFPTAARDPVIMIACALQVAGKICHKVCFTMKCANPRPSDPADGRNTGSYFPLESTKEANEEGGDEQQQQDQVPVTVYVFNDEREMLMAFRQYMVECDPDAYSGWNIDNFDMPYMAGRASALGIYPQFMTMTRMIRKRCWIRESRTESKAHGVRISKELLCEGRFSFDGLLFMLRGQTDKHPSYKLNYFSKLYLKDEKLDVDYSQIPVLFEGTDEDRTRLLWYCLKDTLLPGRILQKRMAIVNGVEQSRVTGVPLKWLLSRGQGVKTFSGLLRKKKPHEHPASRSAPPRPTAGGHVEEPKRGFYTSPTVTVDFASLYPSVMRAYNICYTTKVPRAWAEANLKPKDYHSPFPSVDAIPEGPNTNAKKRKLSKKERDRAAAERERAGKETDFVFVKEHIRKGVLPDMLEDFMKARTNVKNMMKKMKDTEELYCVYDGRQLALKVVCNSVYGFVKGFTVRDDDLMEAVTSWGRHLWEMVAAKIKELFTGRMVIDCAKTRKAGVDPEEEPKAGPDGIVVDKRVYVPCEPNIVYGDTDSVMTNFGDITLAEAIRFGKEISAECNKLFPAPISLTFETVKLVFLLLNRKRYAALQLERFIEGERMAAAILRAQENEANTAFKGLESKRRDNAPIGGGTQGHVLEIILHEQNVVKAESYVKERIRALLMGELDMSQLVITKGLSKSEEQYARGGTKQQHVELRKRIQKRALETGEMVPETGDRVPYVMVCGTANKKSKHASKASELSEDPLYAMRNGIPIDTRYYIEKQIMPAVLRVFTGIYEPERCWEIESDMSDAKLRTFKAYQKLFAPSLPHMQAKRVPRVRGFGMAAWAQVMPACLGCGTLMPKVPQGTAVGPVCKHCDPIRVYVAKEEEQEICQKAHDEAWDICRRCQGGSFGKVTCSNVSCDNFFHRERVVTDLEDIQKEMKRFL